MDRYRITGFRSETHFVRTLAGLHEEYVKPQLLAEIIAQELARAHPRAVVVLTRDRDAWEKIVRATRPPQGRGPFLVSGDFEGDLP